ncbi:MAG: peptide chain release factor N(5)-glutamine methyltransferase [Tannerella sp.]|jgi:release factor glutamine methyltransferase|nr:peptide chain release factor N(5)-glutamine methyltransferase [Tannerella sp.]
MNETVTYIKDTLQTLYPPDEIRSLTRWIMEYVCGLPLHEQILRKDRQLSGTEKTRIREMVQRLEQSEPLQYVLGEVLFHGLPFEVNPSVLIPRPETEELVAHILRTASRPDMRILDIGTGSGCIAVTLAKRLPGASVMAVDISEAALDTAKRNARRNRVAVCFRQMDILSEAASALPPFDLIVSNPPYVKESEKALMERNVLDFEPRQALFVPDDDPLLFYRRITGLAREKLAKNGSLHLEINEACGALAAQMLRDEGFRPVELLRDLSGKDRFIEARIPNPACRP